MAIKWERRGGLKEPRYRKQRGYSRRNNEAESPA